jgi:hypothetical protein
LVKYRSHSCSAIHRDSAICFVFAAIALGSFLALGAIVFVLWRKRPVKQGKTSAA